MSYNLFIYFYVNDTVGSLIYLQFITMCYLFIQSALPFTGNQHQAVWCRVTKLQTELVNKIADTYVHMLLDPSHAMCIEAM